MNRIHFLNTGHSDCILLESNGHFALVDAGEDNDYPESKPHLKYKGYEDEVIAYLLKHCKGENGLVTLDFILGTHAHSDHLGGFDSVILHPEIRVKQAYVRKYIAENVFVMERMSWDNQEVFDQMINALEKTNTPICYNFNHKSFMLGDMKITFSHGENRKYGPIKFGENINSVVTLVEVNGTKTILTGDMNYKAGDERRIAKEFGKADILKVGHHGYFGSTSLYFIKKVLPKFAIVPNAKKRIYPDVLFKLTKIAHAELHTTEDENGIIATIAENGDIQITTDIM